MMPIKYQNLAPSRQSRQRPVQRMRFLSNSLLIFFLVARGSGVLREHCDGCGARLLVFCRYMTTPNQSKVEAIHTHRVSREIRDILEEIKM